MIAQGDQYLPLVQYGGISNEGSGDQVRNTVHELAVTAQPPFWKTATVNLAAPAFNREGHSMTWVGSDNVVSAIIFGGRDENGGALQQTEGIYPEYPTDSTVRWVLYYPMSPNALQPAKRAEHSAAATAYFHTYVFGGRDSSGQPLADLWHLSPAMVWDKITGATGQAPSARWAHTAVMDPIGKMLVFGGLTDSATLATNAVYALTLSTMNWSEVVPAISDSNLAPVARRGHVAIWDPAVRSKNNSNKFRMVLFGGQSSSGYLNDAWVLERDQFGTSYSWRKLDAQGRPATRSRSAALYDQQREQLLVIGGDSTYAQGGGQTSVIWALPLRPALVGDSAWRLIPAGTPPSGRAGQAVALDAVHFHKNRTPDRFNPNSSPGSQWTGLSWAPKLMPFTYPFLFTLHNNRVFWAGPNGRNWNNPYVAVDDSSYFLELDPNLTSHGWRRPGIPNRGGDTPDGAGWWGGSAVLYQIDADSAKIMKCGGNHNWGELSVPDDSTSTYTIAISPGGTSAGWAKVGLAPDILTHRRDHNLVVLPTGKLLVVGGAGNGIRAKPQIWDPATRKWGAELAEEPVVRNYHSSAVLLPSAEVLCAGGRPDFGEADAVGAYRGAIYDPPYLFKPDGTLATRPVASGSPQRVRYGAQFSVCLSSPDSISKACLIRPGAATHAFDQNQRYVPLTFTPASLPTTSRLTVTAPPDSFVAPPGDYMLFLVNKNGVPSIARWVRMGASWNEPDNTLPATITDLTTDFLTCHSISLYWTASGDDGTSGVASYADLRRSKSPITAANFGSATAVNPQPVPICPGTLQFFNATGLTINTQYYFAIKFSDESGNVSLISNIASASTLDQCGIGERAELARGGTSAAGARSGEGTSIASPSGATPTAAANGGSPLVIQAEPRAGGLDVTIRAVAGASPEGGAALAAGGAVLQMRDDTGQWAAAGQYDLPVGERFALPAPDRARRWVFLQPLTLKNVLPEVSCSGCGWIMSRARHSRDGDVTGVLSAGGAVPTMSAGDTLSVHYVPSDSVTGAPAWFVVMEWPGTSTTRARLGRRPDAGAALPTEFALHQNLPNPFAATTTIGFALPVASPVRLEVYDLLGRKVRTLANATYPPGEHQVVWNRRTSGGALAAPGLYFYRMEAGQYREKKRMVILP